MKRLILATEILDSKDGFLMEIGSKAIFLESDASYVTDKLIRKFINKVCDINRVGDSIRQSALYDKSALNDFRRRISKAHLEKKDSGKIVYYTISGNGFTLNFPKEDFNKDVIIIN